MIIKRLELFERPKLLLTLYCTTCTPKMAQMTREDTKRALKLLSNSDCTQEANLEAYDIDGALIESNEETDSKSAVIDGF